MTALIDELGTYSWSLVGLFCFVSTGLFAGFYLFTSGLENRLVHSFAALNSEIDERRKAEADLLNYKTHLSELVDERAADLATANAALKLNEERLEALLQLSQRDWDNETELTDYALEEGVRLTSSQVLPLPAQASTTTLLSGLHAIDVKSMNESLITDLLLGE